VVGTLSALALGLLITSAKKNLDDAQMELRRSSASVVLLDRLLLQYGSEAEPSRILLRQFLDVRLARGWVPASEVNGIGEDVQDLEVVQDSLRQLVPPSDEQLLLQKHMLAVSGEIAESHWLAMAQSDEGLPTPFITVLVFWLSFLFFTFGLQSPRNSTVICILAVCAIAVAAAVFIVSDMANPFLGVIRVSISPLRAAVARIDQN
jgi:hypothetical protein